MKILWFDLETTGLDPRKEDILEIGAAVANTLQLVDTFNTVVHSKRVEEPSSLDPFIIDMHSESGLLEESKKTNLKLVNAEALLYDFIKKHFNEEKVILAGNSIHFDRGFIKAHLPSIESLLHYRMMDVSTLKIIFEGIYGIEFKKKKVHRSMDDIQESIAEFATYLRFIKESGPHGN